MSSDMIARKINEDKIHILVNLNGYTKVYAYTFWLMALDITHVCYHWAFTKKFIYCKFATKPTKVICLGVRFNDPLTIPYRMEVLTEGRTIAEIPSIKPKENNLYY